MTQIKSNLPESSDKKFWGEDAVMETYQQTHHTDTKTHGNFYKVSGFVVCGNCEGSHTISFDQKKFKLVDGKLQKIEPVDKLNS